MLKTTLAGLRAHLGRLMLSAVAVVLGVAFVTGTFTFTATARSAFFDRFAAQARNVDAAVKPQPQRTLPASTLAAVRGVPGVAAVEGRIRGTAALLDRSGKVIASGDAAGTAIDVPADPRFRDLRVSTGRLPASPSEALLDADTATRQRLHPGDTVTVLGTRQERVTVTLTGLMDLGVNKQLASSGASVIALPAAGVRAVTGATGYDRIDVAADPGVGQTTLAARIRGAVGTGPKVVTGARLAHDLADSVTGQVDLFLRGLLTFGLVALVVAALVINNTFKILIAQRLREIALLRCVGATRRQVFTGVLTEAAIVGLGGSVAGVFAGLGLASGMRALLNVLGVGIPSGPVVVSSGGIAGGLLTGTLVTLGAALLPAVLATRVSPMAALRGQPEGRTGDPRRRALRIGFAAILAAVGAMVIAGGISQGMDGLFTVVAGGCLIFAGTLIAGPLLVVPLAAALGWPAGRYGGIPARLAVAGARRNPGRTSTTMMALTIGVGLMTLFTVVLSTVGDFANAQLDRHYPADYLITPIGSGAVVPPSVAADLRSRPQIASVAQIRISDNGHIGTGRLRVAAVDPAAYGSIYRPRIAAGAPRDPRPGQVALYERLARRTGARVGGRVMLTTPRGGRRSYTVTAIFTSQFSAEEALMSWADYARGFAPRGDDTVGVLARHGVAPRDSRAAIDQVVANRPLLRVSSAASYKAQLNSAIDQATALLGALLATAVLIALLGIANTMSLSILERGRESALLRALGLTRRQLRRTLSAEAVLIAAMGGLVGVTLGALFGWAVAQAFLHDGGGGPVAFPAASIVAYLATGALAGLLAAAIPARRATRISIIAGLTGD